MDHQFKVTLGDLEPRDVVQEADTAEAAVIALFPRVLEQARGLRDMAVIEHAGKAVVIIDGANVGRNRGTAGAFLYGDLGRAIERERARLWAAG